MPTNIMNKRSHTLINLIFSVVLVLGIVVSLVVYIKGDSVAHKTVELIAGDVPSYDLLQKLNNSLIEKEHFLYEFYATEQEAEFKAGYSLANKQAQTFIDGLFIRFGDIPPLRVTQSSLTEMNRLADVFAINIMATQTDWELARQQLKTISDVRRATNPKIQQLVSLVEGKMEESESIILSGLQIVRLFVVLYGLATLFIAYVIARAIKAYLSTSAKNQRLSLFPTRNPNPIISLESQNHVTYYNPATDKLLKRLGLPIGQAHLLLADELCMYQQQVLSDEDSDSKQFEYQIGELHFQCDLHWLADQYQWDMHLTEITVRKKIESELQYRASHNYQSGLKNRYELEKSASELCQEGEAFSFGLIEIRSFSQLLSKQGVTVASTVAIELAGVIDNVLTSLNLSECNVFHAGEKSFALISKDHLSKIQIYTLVEQIEQKVAETIFHCQHQVKLDFGFACFPHHGNDVTQLYKSALAALDKSASSGDKAYVVFNVELGEKLRYEQQLIEDMRLAMELAQFELYFQPQMALSNKTVVGAEVLIRWQRDGKWIAPSAFIPLAEKAGLIEPLGDWILHTACLKAKKFINLGLDELVIAVNISPLQFGRKDFLAKVQSALTLSQLPAKNLELEITEGVLVQNEQDTVNILKKLKQLGVHLAIDDFGTGYSSLSYLQKFNIDKLKIDQSFIRNIQHLDADRSIVRTIIELGHNLKLKVIAEGVENLEQENLLKDMKCDETQGYYFSHPLPERNFIQFLQLSEDR